MSLRDLPPRYQFALLATLLSLPVLAWAQLRDQEPASQTVEVAAIPPTTATTTTLPVLPPRFEVSKYWQPRGYSRFSDSEQAKRSRAAGGVMVVGADNIPDPLILGGDESSPTTLVRRVISLEEAGVSEPSREVVEHLPAAPPTSRLRSPRTTSTGAGSRTKKAVSDSGTSEQAMAEEAASSGGGDPTTTDPGTGADSGGPSIGGASGGPATTPPPATSARRAATTTTTPPRPTTTFRAKGTEVGDASFYEWRAGTCAHRTLPKGTVVRVTNTANKRSTTCVVDDRGPFIDGRIIDLETTVFARIADLDSGVVPVTIAW